VRKLAKAVALCLGSAVLLAVAAVAWLPNTAWGREKLRASIERALNAQFAGRVRIGRIDGPLWSGATVHSVVITDSSGAPFLTAEQVRATWRTADLWNRQVLLDSVQVVRPVIVLDRLPGRRWNWDAILFPDTTKTPRGPEPQFGDVVELRNLQLIDATLTARSPYEVEPWRTAKARDSLLTLAVAGKLRPVVRAVPGGYQRITTLERLSLRVPFARIKRPGTEIQYYQIASGSAIVNAFQPPPLDLRNVSGIVQVDRDSVWFRNMNATLPQSTASFRGQYNLLNGNTNILASAPAVATDDWRWLVPALPRDGGGSIADVRYTLRGASSDIVMDGLRLAVEDARLSGTLNFGFDKDDTRLDDVRVRVDGLDTKLVQRLLPGTTLPRSGVLRGDISARGPLTGATVNARLQFADRAAGLLGVRARGIVGSVGTAIVTKNLRLDLAPIPVTLASAALTPLGGSVSGAVTVDGRTDGWLRTRLDLVHRVGETRSFVDGTARVNIAGAEPQVDAQLRLTPVSLVALGRFAPALDLRGTAAGTLTLRGALSDLAVDTEVRVEDAGGLRMVGRVGVPDTGPSRANVVITADSLDLRRIMPAAIATRLVGTARIDARGSSAETLEGRVALDLRASRVDKLQIDSVTLRAAATDGLLRLDTLELRVGGASGTGSGTFGLRKDRSGELQIALSIDSLQRLRPYLPADSALIAPTEAAVLRSLRRQRADSLALAKRTEVERAARGLAPIALKVTPPPAIRGDSLAGSATAVLTLRGWLRDISGNGQVNGLDLFVNGTNAQRVELRPEWAHLRTDSSAAGLATLASGVSTAGFAIDSVRAAAQYAWRNQRLEQGTGDLSLRLHLIDSTRFGLQGALVLDSARYLARVDSTTLVLPRSRWSNPYPWRAAWAGGRLTIDSLSLQTDGDARLQLDAAVDTAGATNVTLAVRNTQLVDLAELAQSTTPVDGRVSADVYVDGTAADPTLSFLGAIRDVVYDSLPLPDFRARLNYKAKQAVAYAEVRRPGQQPNARADATIPMNLALTGKPKRLIDAPMSADIRLDSLPLDVIPQFSAAVTNVKGDTRGRVTIGGTLPDRLTFDGGLQLRNGEAFIVATEVPIRGMAGDLRFRGDSLVVDSVLALSGDGTVRVTGGIALKDITDPVFDLKLVARNARVVDGSLGRIRGLADLTLTGPYTAASIDGSLRVREGVYRLQESPRVTQVLNANDPAVLGAVDSTEAIERGLVVPPSVFVRGLKTQVVARIDRNVWVRSKEANVEVFTDGELAVAVNPVTGGVTLDGTVSTERGQYEFLTRRFNIVRGSATFIGTSDLNPLLQATAEIQVRQPSQQALAVRLNIGGTLLRPRLSLESDAQPPIPQTDLITYLAFGSSSGTLLSQSGTGAGGTTASGRIGGAIANNFLTRQLSALGLGMALNSLSGSAARLLGADVLNITSNEGLPELLSGTSPLGGFLLASKLEYGRYFGTQNYVVVTLEPGRFSTDGSRDQLGNRDGRQVTPIGVRWEYRLSNNYRLETSFGPRFLLQSQTLQLLQPSGLNNFGLFLSREWKW
jgi:translocation and assembly module TamB